MQTLFPFSELKKGEWSFCPPKCGADPENNMIYSADMGIGKVAATRVDLTTGEMETAFVRDALTGRILAESDFFEPLTINSLTPPGYGGRVYFPSAVGKGFYSLQVTPTPKAVKK